VRAGRGYRRGHRSLRRKYWKSQFFRLNIFVKNCGGEILIFRVPFFVGMPWVTSCVRQPGSAAQPRPTHGMPKNGLSLLEQRPSSAGSSVCTGSVRHQRAVAIPQAIRHFVQLATNALTSTTSTAAAGASAQHLVGGAPVRRPPIQSTIIVPTYGGTSSWQSSTFSCRPIFAAPRRCLGASRTGSPIGAAAAA
jgi:hypothetical protein